MSDVVVGVIGLVIMGLAYGIIPGSDKVVWVWRPPQNKVAAAFAFSVFTAILVKGVVQLAH
jgi:hypothetical protein